VHVLTKTLVVLAAVLSVALSALVIAYAVNTDRIAADYANALRRVTVAEANLSASLAAAKTTETQLNATIAALNNQLLQAKTARDDLAAENAALRTAVAKAESERQSVVNKIAELGETTRTQAEIIKNYREENSSLRNNDLNLRTRQAELDDRINDLESQREVLEQNYRALQEQIAEAKRAQEQLLSGGGSGAAGALAPIPNIKGRVEAVQYDDVLKKTIVKINVGANDRVGKNMAFYITRGSTFIGRVQVTHDPDLKFSVGELVLLNPGQEVRVGDQISSHL
jgi:predicted  nucleic acid-binding Zn-ribbon protein